MEEFCQACRDDRHDIIDSMIADGYIPTTASFVIACQKGNQPLVLKLLGYENIDFYRGFLAAVRYGQMHLLDHLYITVDINKPDANGSTALHIVGNIKVAEWLLDMGAVQTTDYRGNTPLYYACEYGNTELIKLLLRRGTQPPYTYETILFNAASKEWNIVILTPLLQYMYIHEKDKTQILHNCDPKLLYYACLNNYSEIAKLLIEYMISYGKYQRNQTFDDYSDTLLHYACTNDDIEIVKLLLKCGETQIPNMYGKSPLHIACSNQNIEMVKLLLESMTKDGGIQTPNNHGHIPLHIACINGNTKIIKLLLQNMAVYGVIQTPNKIGNMPLHYACMRNYTKAVQLLLSPNTSGFNSSSRDSIRGECGILIRNNRGCIPLHDACLYGYIEIVKLLLMHMNIQDIQIPNNKGNTPLHLAIHNGHIEVVKLLLQHIPKRWLKQIRNKKGKLPVDIAREMNYEIIIELLDQRR